MEKIYFPINYVNYVICVNKKTHNAQRVDLKHLTNNTYNYNLVTRQNLTFITTLSFNRKNVIQNRKFNSIENFMFQLIYK